MRPGDCYAWYPTLAYIVGQAVAQIPPAQVQNTTFNSTTSLTPDQIAKYQLNQTWADALNLALQYEQSNYAGGSVRTDSFYTVPANSGTATAGSVFKVEEHVNLSTYTVAPNIAMSRFLYQTENFNGTAIPASAFVLWPYAPRLFDMTGDKIPTLGWAHGTSGWCAECAPSHMRNLDYQFGALFELALQGYAVVAPDYAGLGVGTDASGNRIAHQYMAHPAAANDLVYAVQAAQQAWPELSREFVVIGHSQGGGTAWAVAQRQALKPADGYLGTVAASPVTDALQEGKLQPKPDQRIATTALALDTIFEDFQLSDWLTDRGIKSLEVLQDIQGCQSVATELFYSSATTKVGWNETWSARQFTELMGNGGRPIAGPMLVLQGTLDSNVPIAATNLAVNKTCEMFPHSQLEYRTYQGAQHTPTLYASQRVWFDWIQARFEGDSVPDGCQMTAVTPYRPVSDYYQNPNWILEYTLWEYES